MADRDAELAAFRGVRMAASDDELAARHAAKLTEIEQVRARTEAARGRVVDAAGTWSAEVDGRGGLVGQVGAKLRRLAHLVALVGPAIRYSGGLRGAVRRGVALLRREGLSGLRYGVQVADQSREAAPDQLAAVFGRPVTEAPEWYTETDPEVSIVVRNDNRADATIGCLRSVWQHTAGLRYEIVLVDDGSRPEDFVRLVALEGPCRLVRHPVERHFGEAHNLGVEAAAGRLVVLLDPSVTVTDGWLEGLVAVMRARPDCGAVGPAILGPGGLVQEVGELLDERGAVVRLGEHGVPDDVVPSEPRAVDVVPAACMLLRKDDFERVLGYDMFNSTPDLDHADLCLKVSQLGLTVYCAPEAIVVRHSRSADAYDSASDSTAEMSRGKYLSRWGDYLRTGRHSAPREARRVLRCAPRGSGPTAGVYSPHPMTPGGGERYILGLVAQLQRLGWHVTLVTPARYSRLRLTALSSVFGIELDGLCLETLDEARDQAPFDEFVAMGIQLVPPVEPLGRRNTFLCQFPFPTPQDEIRRAAEWFAGYDRVIVYSAFAASAMAARMAAAGLPALPIEIVAPAVPLSDHPLDTAKSGIVSVGRFFVGGHSKRQDLQIKAFRELVASGGAGDTVLHLVGASSTEPENRRYVRDCMAAAEGLPIEFHIDAGAAVLEGLYQSCSLFWHSSGLEVDVSREPERCEHFGISPIEAMSYGTIPLVVDNGGPAAIITDGVDGCHYHDVSALVEKTARLLAMSEDERLAMRVAARARANDYSEDAFAARVAEVFTR